MKDSLNDYFRQEVQWLNELLSGFRQRHPLMAAEMKLDSVQDTSPTVARLLEGCAYLNARISQQIDLGAGLITESLVRRLAEAFLEPYPSKTMIECRLQPGRMTKPLTLAAGVKLQSEPVGEESVACSFETLSPITIQPLVLTSSRRIEQGKACSVELFFELNEASPFFSISSVPLYLNAERGLAAEWLYSLLRGVESIGIKQAGEDLVFIGGQERIRIFDPLEQNRFSSTTQKAFALRGQWLDYFLFRESCHQLMLDLSEVNIHHYQFSIQIQFRPGFEMPRLGHELFKLHCVPAINQFPMSAEPIRYSQARERYPLTLLRHKKDAVRLLKINSVKGIRRGDKKAFSIDDFYRTKQDQTDYCYRLSQNQKDKNQIDSYLNFMGLDDEELSLSLEVTAFNGHYPHQHLSASSLRVSDKSVPAFLSMTNLHRPTSFYQPALNAVYYEQLLGQLRVDFSCLMNRKQLIALLASFDLSRSYQQQLEAILSVSQEPFHQIRRGKVERGLVMELIVDERAFVSLADIFSLGQMIHSLFKRYASPDSLIETVVLAKPSEKKLYWKNHD